MSETRALSKQQFLRSGFDKTPYDRNYGPGEYVVRVDCKRWCRNASLLSYLTVIEDGHKIEVPSFGYSGYGGLAEHPIGSIVQMEIHESRTGTIYARRSKLLEAPAKETVDLDDEGDLDDLCFETV